MRPLTMPPHVKMGADLYISNIFTPKNLLINGNNLNLGSVIDNSGNTVQLQPMQIKRNASSLSITGAGNLLVV